jgi:long-chain acyl-CoA synthetase
MTPDGFVKTSDAGFFEKDGQLRIIDRVKDVGKLNNGRALAPKYIENKLKFFPNIREVGGLRRGRGQCLTVFINIDLDGGGQLGRAQQHLLRLLHRSWRASRCASAA